MVPFNVRLKAYTNGNKMTHHIELNVYETSYRLLPYKKITINGSEQSFPYSNPAQGISIYKNGDFLVLQTDFSLKIRWNGERVEVSLCKRYAQHVCGLCGRGVHQSQKSKYFVDRNDKVINGAFKWISAWRVPDDDKKSPAQ